MPSTKMTGELDKAIAGLCSNDAVTRGSAAAEVYRSGRSSGEHAVSTWWSDSELSALLLGPDPEITVGLAVERETFAKIHAANGAPRLAEVPPDQDAEEFELHFLGGIALDILTTKEPGGPGAIARFLARFSEGVQQVEFRCKNVERATQILKERFGVAPIYPETHLGANATRVNFFLVPAPEAGKVLIELYEESAK